MVEHGRVGKLRKTLTFTFREETLKRLHEVKEESGIPMNQLLERSFEKSEFYGKHD
jgi:hypothetical protein